MSSTDKKVASKVVDEIYSSLSGELESHLRSSISADKVEKWKKANAKLSEMATELDNFDELARALNAGDSRTSKIMSMVRSQDPNVIKTLYDNLSPQGKINMKALAFSKAALESGGIDNISPDKFLVQTKKNARLLGVVLDNKEMKDLAAFQRALEISSRAAQVASEPRTGFTGIPLSAGKGIIAALGGFGLAKGGVPGMVAGAATGAGVVYTIGQLGAAFESKAVRDLLVKAPKFTPGSKAELDWARKVVIAMETAALENGQPEQQGE